MARSLMPVLLLMSFVLLVQGDEGGHDTSWTNWAMEKLPKPGLSKKDEGNIEKVIHGASEAGELVQDKLQVDDTISEGSKKDESNIQKVIHGASKAGEVVKDKLQVDDTISKEMINKGAEVVKEAVKGTGEDHLDWAKAKTEELLESGLQKAAEVTDSARPKVEDKGETAKSKVIGDKVMTASKDGETMETAKVKMTASFKEPMGAGLADDVTGRTMQAHFQEEL